MEEVKKKEDMGFMSSVFGFAVGGFLTALSAALLIPLIQAQGFGLELEWNRALLTCFGFLGFFGASLCVILCIVALDAKRAGIGVK